MQDILLKRLDIIRTAVAIEDDELIEMQLAQIRTLALDERARWIVDLIEAQQFALAMQLLEQYRSDNSSLTRYEDPEIQGLRLELKVLENRATELSNEKVEYERQINHFNSEYMLRLGDLIEEILRRQATQATFSAEEQKQAEQDYASFRQDHQQQMEELTEELAPEQKRRLKAAYRKASSLCHPDKLGDEFKERGETFFKALNDAYRRQDIQQVTEILAQLQSGATLSAGSDCISDKTLLQNKIALLRESISQLEDDIARLLADETYQTIQAIDDWDAYFDSLRLKLEAQLEELRNQGTQPRAEPKQEPLADW